jgi:RNA polymerase sigma factor (sigma-70 family)
MDTLEQVLNRDDRFEELFDNRRPKPESIDNVPADDVVSVYFRQMAVEPLLTAEQEVALAKRIERGVEAERLLNEHKSLTDEEIRQLRIAIEEGQAAREHMAAANTRLVVSIAKRYRNQGLPLSDLIQEGNLGLMRAVDKFDYTMGNRFSTYATWWIRQTITRALSQKARTIRLPLHLSDQLRRINAAIDTMAQDLGREPTYRELGEHLEIPTSQVRWAVESTPQTIAMEIDVGEDSELSDFIEDENAPDPDDTVHSLALRNSIDRALSQMVPREAQILRLRYGLDSGSPLTLKQVGKVMGLSRERIRQLERQALQNLREPQFEAILTDFLPS